MGAKILSQYALLSSCDFVNILEAKNNKIVSKVAVELGTRGMLQTLTMADMTLDEFIGNL